MCLVTPFRVWRHWKNDYPQVSWEKKSEVASVDIMISREGTSFYQKMMVSIRILYILTHFHKYKFRGKLKSEGFFFETDQMIKLGSSIRGEATEN